MAVVAALILRVYLNSRVFCARSWDVSYFDGCEMSLDERQNSLFSLDIILTKRKLSAMIMYDY
jgi:hypothetical protein